MIFDEYEIKYLISKNAYENLLELFSDSTVKTFEQVNYYYDTSNQRMRSKNVTVRVRDKNGKLTQTIKEHFRGTTHSKETSFRVDRVSNVISYNDENLYLYGTLYTKRTEINIIDGIKMMLDYNKYLDTEDYEFELEYELHNYEDGIRVIQSLQPVLGSTELLVVSEPKSERFYKKFFESDRVCTV